MAGASEEAIRKVQAMEDDLEEDEPDDVNEIDQSGNNMLHWAAQNGTRQTIQYLVREGKADVNCQRDEDGKAALHLVAENGFLACMLDLIEMGANVNLKDHDGNLALHWAAMKGRREICERLLEKAPEQLNQANEKGDTAVHLSARNNGIEVLRMLIKKGAKLTQPNLDNQTPFAIATQLKNRVIMSTLRKQVLVGNRETQGINQRMPDIPTDESMEDTSTPQAQALGSK